MRKDLNEVLPIFSSLRLLIVLGKFCEQCSLQNHEVPRDTIPWMYSDHNNARGAQCIKKGGLSQNKKNISLFLTLQLLDNVQRGMSHKTKGLEYSAIGIEEHI